MEPTKTCPRCRAEKPLSEFGTMRSAKDGLNRYCRECWSEYRSRYRRARTFREQKEHDRKRLEESGRLLGRVTAKYPIRATIHFAAEEPGDEPYEIEMEF